MPMSLIASSGKADPPAEAETAMDEDDLFGSENRDNDGDEDEAKDAAAPTAPARNGSADQDDEISDSEEHDGAELDPLYPEDVPAFDEVVTADGEACEADEAGWGVFDAEDAAETVEAPEAAPPPAKKARVGPPESRAKRPTKPKAQSKPAAAPTAAVPTGRCCTPGWNEEL